MTLQVKSRKIKCGIPGKGHLTTWVVNLDGTSHPVNVYDDDKSAYLESRFGGIQITESESHPGWSSSFNKNFSGDRGGPFTSRKRWPASYPRKPVTLSGRNFNGVNAWNYASYRGPLLPIEPPYMEYPAWANSTDSQLNALGTTAIARCSPSNPVATLSTFLGETVREGLPKLTKLNWLRNLSNRERRKALADDFLNYEFGWLPFVSDLQDISRSIVNADALWAQHERDSGKLVRRRYEFPTRTETAVDDYGPRYPWYSPSTSILHDSNATGHLYCVIQKVTRQWFSGAFSYYLPPERDTAGRAAAKARYLLGLSLTPDNVWNLAPWSWAVDWFSNTGDVIQNWSNWLSDGQVVMYGYIMEHTRVSHLYVYDGHTGLYSRNVRPPNLELVSETKLRRAATPYGFGFDMDGLSTIQKAIIGALGITRTH